MSLVKEYERIQKYLSKYIPYLPAAYVLDDYNEMIQLWDGLKTTPEMMAELNTARQKSISADTIIKLNEIITFFNHNGRNTKVNATFKNAIIKTIEESKKLMEFNSKRKYKLYILHYYEPNSTYVELYDANNNEMITKIKTKIDFCPFWGILETPKWKEIYSFFEGICFGEDEFIVEFEYAFKLQSYYKLYKVLDELNLFVPANKLLPKGTKIIIGESNRHSFEFVVK